MSTYLLLASGGAIGTLAAIVAALWFRYDAEHSRADKAAAERNMNAAIEVARGLNDKSNRLNQQVIFLQGQIQKLEGELEKLSTPDSLRLRLSELLASKATGTGNPGGVH